MNLKAEKASLKIVKKSFRYSTGENYKVDSSYTSS